MDHQRLDQIDHIFRQVLDVPEKDRESFLKEATLHDPGMFTEVMRLLQYADESQSFFGDTVSDFLAPLEPILKGDEPSADFTFEEGTLVGNYRIKSLLGKGGMGQVYLAERSDGAFEKNVALKCIKKGMDSEEILKRFRNERQILATLQHPNIASLLDGGITEDGRPYLVMEHVDGRPIHKWCDENKLNIRKRCRLLIQVCRAVSHAHRFLVVHRDLKPENILVTNEGEVKLLDFGIARLLDPGIAGLTSAITETQFRFLTPDYSAPEQRSGEAVGTSVDVYALGIILHELLCGFRPKHSVRGTIIRPSAELRTREDGENIAEARASSLKKLYATISGEPDLILMKATHPDHNQRYASVDELADDLERYLNDRPIFAKADSFSYRLKKLVLRNKTAVAVAAIFAFIAIILVSLLIIQFNTTQLERDRALKERDVAEAVTGVFVDMFRANDPFSQRNFNPDTLSVKDFVLLNLDHLFSGLDDTPEIKVRLLYTYSDVLNNLDDPSAAISLLEEALTLTENSPDVASFRPQILAGLAESWWIKRDQDKAFSYITEAVDLLRSDIEVNEADYNKALFLKSTFMTDTGDYEGALELQKEVESYYSRNNDTLSVEAGKLYNSLAITLERLSRYPESLEYYDKSLQTRIYNFGADHPSVALLNVNMASAYIALKDMEKAEELLTNAVEIYDKNIDEEHRSKLIALRMLSGIYRDAGRFEESLSILDRLIEIYQVDEDVNIRSLSVTYNTYVILLQRMNRLDEAESMARLNAELSNRIDSDLLSGPVTRNTLADVLHRQNKHEEAISIYRGVLDDYRRILPEGHVRLAGTLMNLGSSFAAVNQPDIAAEHWLEAFDIYQATFGNEHTSTKTAASMLAGYYETIGNPELASFYRSEILD